MASSSRDVFLSHSGKQKNFIRQLHKDLTREGVSCFFDESRESLPVAEPWPCQILKAADTCRIAVLLLSVDFVDFIQSKWPMWELCAFLKAKSGNNPNLKILPLFYKISPRDLEYLISDTQDIPDQKRPKISDETLIKWGEIREKMSVESKEALKKVGELNGLRFEKGGNKVSFTEDIIKEIRTKLTLSGSVEGTRARAQPAFPRGAVGLEEPVKRITEMLALEKLEERAEVMVIYGIGGIGKTTLAEAVVANLNLNPEAKGFNYAKINIPEYSPKKNELKKMQKQLLKDAFPKYQGGSKIKLRDCEDGRFHLTQAFQCKRNEPVFIFIDNALREKDLQELLPEDLKGLCLGSKILVTARDLRVTNLFEERCLRRRSYRVEPLADEHGKKILCNDSIPLEQIKDDVNKILKICSGIPLLLKIVGAQFKKHKYMAEYCSVILEALENGVDIKEECLTERLFNFVYNRLETSVQEAFLDICSFQNMRFFQRRQIEYIVGVNEVEILEEAALITVVPFPVNDINHYIHLEGEEKLIVHDVILAIGRSMAKGTRIVDDAESLSRAVEDQKGLQSIKEVWFGEGDKSTFRFEESQLSCMSNSLRVFRVGPHMSVTGCSSNTFRELRYLDVGRDVPCLPVNFEELPRLACYKGPFFKDGFKLPKSLRNWWLEGQSNRGECATSEESNPIQTVQNSSLQELVLLRLGNENLLILLNCIDQFMELKILFVIEWDEMEQLPTQVCQLRSLNKLCMWKWKSLKRLPESFSNLTGLTHLDLDNCSRLEGLCSSFGELRCLRYLSLRNSEMLTELPDSLGLLIALEYLNLSGCTSLTILPDNFGQLTALKYLNLFRCSSLKELPDSLGQLIALEFLNLNRCEKLTKLPDNFGQLTALKYRNLFGLQ